MYVYILYLRCEDSILAILCTAGLPITIPIAGEWLNSLIFNDDDKCITANGQPIINVCVYNICQVVIIHFV